MSLPKDQQRIVNSLVHTSVTDMRSTLSCADLHGGLPLTTLEVALTAAEQLGYKTKAKVLKSYISRYQKVRGA